MRLEAGKADFLSKNKSKIDKFLDQGYLGDEAGNARKLMSVFAHGNKQERIKMFGTDNISGQVCVRFMITITATKQFRVWFGLPASFGRTHVDSCGTNCLIEGYGGDSKDLIGLARLILPDSTMVKLQNGTLLFLPRTEDF